ncbi:MAG: hypothetical protein Q7T54_00440 [Candidatus Levybacteria bacterium]|nr:hypothetical protein [Candidatus Levybacteria bacterium]
MVNYKNLSGKSNVKSYMIGDDYIDVKFNSESKNGYNHYKYTYNSAGRENVEIMKSLALNGKGLNEFINTNVKKSYAQKS